MRIASSKLTSLVARFLLVGCLLTVAADGSAQGEPAEARDDTQPKRAGNENGEFYQAAEQVLGGWLYGWAPESLRKRGPYRVMYYQWLALPAVVLLGWLIGVGINRVASSAVRPLVRRTVTRWDDAVVDTMRAPFTLAFSLIAIYFLLPALELRTAALETVHRVLRVLWTGCLFWMLARAVDVASRVIAASSQSTSTTARRSLLALAVRAGKIVVLALAIVALLQQAGYAVGSLLAGLGIGGLAVALAAQKTFEHWLGAFAIALDQPFREGDFVRINGLAGTVEQIGMRSTRLRTLERTVVSIPNGKLAEMQPETFTPRDRMRLNLDLRLVYGTTSAQIREILAGIEKVLRDQPKTRQDSVSVIFRELGVHALVLEVAAFFETLDLNEYNDIRQDVLLQIMAVVENAGTELALPAQRVELATNGYAREFGEEATTGITARDTSRRP